MIIHYIITLLLLTGLSSSCISQTNDTLTTNSTSTKLDTMTHCDTVQQKIINCDFINWTGLPTDCDWTTFVGEIPTDWSSKAALPFGSSRKYRPVMLASINGYHNPSFAFEDGQTVLFQGQSPEISDLQALIKHFDEPAICLDWQFGFLPCKESECVYPERGITLFFNSERTRLFYVALYAPTTLEQYLDNLRPLLGSKRRPRRRR